MSFYYQTRNTRNIQRSSAAAPHARTSWNNILANSPLSPLSPLPPLSLLPFHPSSFSKLPPPHSWLLCHSMSNHTSNPSTLSPNFNPSATTLTLVDPTTTGPTADEPFELERRGYIRIAVTRIGILVVIDAALPTILYYVLKNYMLAVWALVASSSPAVIMVVIQAILKRRVDVVGVLVILGTDTKPVSFWLFFFLPSQTSFDPS